MNRRNILLMMACLACVAADKPRRFDDDMVEILRSAREYRPGGSTIAHVEKGATKDIAWVRTLFARTVRMLLPLS